MNMELWQGLCKLSLFGALIVFNALVASFGDSAFAQITPDNSLENESSTVTPNVNVKGLPGTLIEGGATRNLNNLFHSFSEFNVNNGQRVYFSNPAAIENIFTRVTGGNVSNILGTLGVDGNANLFFLNPNGIIFGENASLDVAGSFFATTADSFDFGNGLHFSATNPQAAPLLTMSVAPGLQYGANPGDITSSGNLTVGGDLAIAGRNLDLKGQLNTGKDLTLEAQDTVKVRDSAANPFIATAGKKLTVQGNQAADIFALNHPESGFFSGGDMVLRSANTVSGDAHYSTGGSFKIEQLDGSLGSLFSPYDPIILANENVTFASYNGPSLHILAGGSVNIGTATINGADTIGNTINQTNSPRLSTVNLSNGTTLQIDGSATPTLDVRAGIDWTQFGGEPGNLGFGTAVPPSVFVSGATRADITIGSISNRLGSSGNGKTLLTNQYAPNGLAGNIQVGSISAYGDLNIDSRGDITASGAIDTSGINNNAGNVSLLANGNIVTRDITTVLNSDQVGFAGDIVLTSRNGFIDTRGGTLNSSVNGSFGFAGNVSLTTNGDIFAGNIFSDLRNDAEGNAGNIDITANSVSLTNGAQISSSTEAIGDAGNITLNAKDTVSLADAGIFSTVEAGGQGTGGDIDINTAKLSLTDGAQLLTLIRGTDGTLASGKGNAGNVKINATDKVELDGLSSGIGSVVDTGAEGNAGNIDITTGSLSLTNGGVISSSTSGIGDGGNIDITANSVSLTNGAQLISSTFGLGDAGNVAVRAKDIVSLAFSSAIFSTVEAGGQGAGGNIDINTATLSLTDGGQLLTLIRPTNGTLAAGNGNAGNVKINATDKVELNGFSDVIGSFVATGAEGNGGNIDITTGSLSLTNGAVINNSTSGIGNAGNVTVSAKDTVSLAFSSAIFSTVETGGQGTGGNIDINTATLSLTDGAQLQTLIRGANDTLAGGRGNAGNITINTTDKVELDGANSNGIYSSISSDIGTGAEGNAGNINITTGSVSLTNRTQITSSTFGLGDAGNVTVSAKDTVFLASSAIFSTVERGGQGTGGDIDINAATLSLSNGGQLLTLIRPTDGTLAGGKGNAGNVKINATNKVELDGLNSDGLLTGIFSTVQAGAEGTGGNIDITTGSLSLTNGAQVNSRTEGIGNAGNVTVNATDTVSLADAYIFSTVEAGGQGTGGNIDITTGSVSLTNGAQINSSTSGIGDAGNVTVNANEFSLTNGAFFSSRTFGVGNAGNITLNAKDTVSLADAYMLSTVEAGGQGTSGNIDINATTLSLTDGAQLQTLIRGTGSTLAGELGNTGNITINATDKIELDGANSDGFPTAILSSVETGAEGNAGNINITTGSLSLTNSAEINSNTSGIGDAGNIDITTGSVSLTNGTSFNNNTSGIGDAGNVTISAKDTVYLADAIIFSTVEAGGQGAGGNIDITTGSVSLSNGAQLQTIMRGANDTLAGGKGNAGNVKINATDKIELDGANSDGIPTAIVSDVQTAAEGNAGNIDITTGSLSLTNGASFSSSTSGIGNAGNITVSAKDTVSLAFTSIISTAVFAEGQGTGGNIDINAGSLSLTNDAEITSSTFGIGDAGNITVSAKDTVYLTDAAILSTVQAGGQGTGGDIDINAATLSLTDGAQLQTLIRRTDGTLAGGKGNAGNVKINATDKVELDGENSDGKVSSINSSIQTGAQGNAGNIDINSGSVSLTNGAFLISRTSGIGDAGNVTMSAKDTVSLASSAISSTVEAGGQGTGGNIDINATTLSLTDGAQLQTLVNGTNSTLAGGKGNAGNVKINTTDKVELDGLNSDGLPTAIFSTIQPGAEGKGGNIDITTGSISLTDGAQLRNSTFGIGNAGNIQVKASDSVEISGFAPYPTLPNGNSGGFSSGLFSTTENSATGEGGMIKVTTDSLRLENGGVLSARTQSTFKGGDITVNANALEINSGGQILSTAFNSGNAGDIDIQVRDHLTISGSDPTYNDRFNQVATEFGEQQAQFRISTVSPNSGIFANTTENSTGKGGNIKIDPILVLIKDGGRIAVNSQGSGQAGNLELQAERLILDKGNITAQATSNDGGNMDINVQELFLLRNSSNISTTAGTAQSGGDGGNIEINAPKGFVIATPSLDNNNITANAFEGSGGNITINTQSVIGIQELKQGDAGILKTNDITASSDFGNEGSININSPDVDPASAINTLPQDVVDPSNLIAQGCDAFDEEEISEFTVTGRGGLPPSPEEPFSSDGVWEDMRLQDVDGEEEQKKLTSQKDDKEENSSIAKINPATGWEFNEKGEVTLLSASNTTPHKLGSVSQGCRKR